MQLDSPIFTDVEAARKHLEAQRWPNGPICPHCGACHKDDIALVKGKKRSHRAGLYYCNLCKGTFTVTVGSVFERSKVPLNKWLLATFLMTSSKKGMSAHQLHRMLGVTYKTAWFMAHRIREAMKEDVKSSGPLGGSGKTVEADETYYGKREDGYVSPQRKGRPYKFKKKAIGKRPIVSLVERGGKVRSFHVKHATKKIVREILVQNVTRDTDLYTDESRLYPETGKEFNSHSTVKHSAGEYVRGIVHTNNIEGFFGVFKKGMKGVYQHCGESHLHRYLAEFDFRFNRRTALKVSDRERHDDLLSMIGGKRLTYRRINKASFA